MLDWIQNETWFGYEYPGSTAAVIAALREAAKNPLSARERWLLDAVSSIGRLTIATEQYDELRALAARLAQALKDAQVDDSPSALETLIQEIEARLFRTDADTGANECALTVWNAVRRYAHLPRITKSDLASYHGECGRYHKRGVCPLERIGEDHVTD
jgi:hypothetical protein